MRAIFTFILRIAKALLVAAGVVAAFCLVVVGFSFGNVMRGMDGSGRLPSDCAMVFGAAVYGNQFPGPAIVRRVGAAGEYYRQGLVTDLIILSGGTGTGNKLSEAQVMKREALKQGIPEAMILTEDDSHSTLENLRYSRPLAKDCERVVGISDAYHLARIDLLARRLDWDNFSTVPVIGGPPPELERQSILREIVAYIYYALRLDSFVHLYTD